MDLRVRAPRVLDLDCENRPLSYLGGDFTTPEITAIAYQVIGKKDSDDCWVLGEDTLENMLHGFVWQYVESDIITGHNIRRHDLPLINAMLLEHGLSPLGPKLVCDTWADLKKRSPGFGSQATLAAMLGVQAQKVGMSTTAWRSANRLEPEGIELTRRRVTGDVRQHIALRRKLLALGWLNPPRRWQP